MTCCFQDWNRRRTAGLERTMLSGQHILLSHEHEGTCPCFWALAQLLPGHRGSPVPTTCSWKKGLGHHCQLALPKEVEGRCIFQTKADTRGTDAQTMMPAGQNRGGRWSYDHSQPYGQCRYPQVVSHPGRSQGHPCLDAQGAQEDSTAKENEYPKLVSIGMIQGHLPNG